MIRKNLLYIVLSLIGITAIASCGVSHKKKRYLNQTYKEIKETFPQAQVNIVQDSIKMIFPNNLVFDISSAQVKETFKSKLDKFGGVLKKYEKTYLLVTGHTDNSGDEADNMKLSLDRADAVKDYLKKSDIDNRRLFTWGLGEKSPITGNNTEASRAKNRRVEFVVLYKPTSKK